MAITRITDTTSDLWVRPHGQVPSNAGATDAEFVATDNVQDGANGATDTPRRHETADLKETVFAVNDAGTGETIATGIQGIVSVWWMGDDVSTDNASLFVSAVATGTIHIVCENAAIEGYILIKHRG